ncbi:hypothetical protein LO763_26670 [Glycomyces sp. A-F 0318]|uniref:hypothetical protein n=1 Tax=Glycomyces amatae TaxID=2881355 RepID=UPI001E47CA62|nr:hypothetical protein [Glycomyces amatae]MCD0447204.1 hypothetical protein [Glycomyces amatae]
MNLQDDPGAVFRNAVPDIEPPPARFDLDRIVQDGYRVRRRHRAVLGGAATTGVAAVAAVLALSAGVIPGGTTDPADDATSPPPADTEAEDPAMSGYPYDDDWGMVLNEDGEQRSGSELLEVKEAATEAFGELLAGAGVWEDPANPGAEEECSWITVDGGTQAEVDACMVSQGGMPLGADQEPGNYGQTYLRSYQGAEVEEADLSLRTIFEFELALPGGWTAEPGPMNQQVFPQHLIGDGAYFTDEAPELTTERLDDGRTLTVADHGCAAEIAVVYPNGTGLRVTWNDCLGTDHPLDIEAFTEAALSMPEMDLDTAGLAPVGDLVEVPPGWAYDEDAWADSEEAEDQAHATFEAARAALLEVYPGASLGEGNAVSTGQMERGANMRRTYSSHGTLPISTVIDGTTDDVGLDLRYYLPGGWIPGYSETGHWDPHLTVCKEGFECTTATDDDGTVWAFEEFAVTYSPEFEGEDWEPYTEHQLYVTRYSPEGWAVGAWVQWTDDAPIDADLISGVLRAMPAPEYDREAVPELSGD